MLINQRHSKILNILEENDTISVKTLSKMIGASESTIRRDLSILDREKKLKKVFGGATVIGNNISLYERNITEKSTENVKEKTLIAKYASSLIHENECVYLDSGTTTMLMVDFINSKTSLFVTNGIEISKKLTQKNFNVILLGGNVKLKTDSIIGQEAINMIQKFNFSKGFFGTNGITEDDGFTTHDINEANIKFIAINKCKNPYIISDRTKFGSIYSVTFANINDCKIITFDNKYHIKNKNQIIDVKNF